MSIGIKRYKNVRSRVAICAPSTSASVIIIILSYLNFSRSKSSWIPVPKAVIIAFISAFPSILSSLAFSTLSIFPLNGRIACVALLRAVFADPPAESPSTMKISQFAGFLSEQSASLPGNPFPSRAVFLLLVRSLAFLAASLALCARIDFSQMLLATCGFCSRKYLSCSLTTFSTAALASLFPSFCFVWPSNCGSGILMLIIAVRPSLISSPVRFCSLSFNNLFVLA